MYSVKPVLCAAAGGAIALTVAWLFWEGPNIKREPVDVTSNQIATEAPKTLGLPATSTNLATVAPKQSAAEAPTILGFPAATVNLVDVAPKQIAPKILNSPATSANLKAVAPKQITAEAPKTFGLPKGNPNLAAVASKQLATNAPNILGFPAASANPGAVASKRVANEAPKTLGFHVASANLSAVPSVPSSPPKEDWYLVPPNKGALVLFVPRVASNRVVVVRDEIGKLLDFVDAKSGLPLLRQYRLDPGTYELNLRGFASVTASVKSGKITIIQLSQTGLSVTRKLPPKEHLTRDGLQDPNNEPQQISSVEKILYFTAELPSRWQAQPHYTWRQLP
jgi:hypothetical protein